MRHFILTILFFTFITAAAQQSKKTIIYFDTDQWHLTNSHKNYLDSITSYLLNQQDYHVSIQGHTDNIGDSLYNIRLSERRSNSVAKFLESKLDRRKISINYHGENKPIDSNSNDQKRTYNRRVEILYNTDTTKTIGYIKDLKEFYRLIAPQPQEFCVNNNRDTVLQGDEGTIIYIKANSFDVPKNSTECVKITLKERYRKSLIVGDNLATITQNNEILISQAMFEINANVPLNPQTNLITFAPTDTIVQGISPFYGERDRDDMMHWFRSSDNISNISGSGLNGFLNGVCTQDTTVYDTLSDRCPLFFCKILDWIRIKKFTPVIDSIVKKDTIPCPMPPQLKPFFLDTLSLEQMKNLPQDSLKYYVFSTARLGWRNLDWLMKIKNKTDYKVYIKPDKDIDIKLIFKNYRSVVPLSAGDNYYYFSGAPLDYEAWLLAFKILDGEAYIGIEDVKIGQEGHEGFNFEKVTLEELYMKLKVFDQKD
jgi:OmpA family